MNVKKKQELLESWVNGNRKDVVRYLLDAPTSLAAAQSVLFARVLFERDMEGDVATLGYLLYSEAS